MKLEFVYCSVGRETVNKRNIYDADWNPLYFCWVQGYKDPASTRGEEIPAPESFDEMKRIGAEIAKEFDYVRVDFYDVDGKLYYGEVTFYHGGGMIFLRRWNTTKFMVISLNLLSVVYDRKTIHLCQHGASQ